MLYLLCSCLYEVVFPFWKLLLTLRIRDVLSGCDPLNIYCNTPLSEYDIICVQYFVTTYLRRPMRSWVHCGGKTDDHHMLAVWSSSAGTPVISTALLNHCRQLLCTYMHRHSVTERLLLNCTSVTVSMVCSIQRTRKLS